MEQQIVNESRIQTICLLVLTAVAIGFALHWLRPVMIPFVLALFVSFTLSLLVDFLRTRLRFPHILALLTSLGFTFLIFLFFANLISISIGELAANANTYQKSVLAALDRLVEWFPEDWGIDSKDDLRPYYEVPVKSLGGMLLGTTNAIVDILSRSTLVFIFVMFLMLGSSTGPVSRKGFMALVETRVKRYLLTKVTASTTTGVLVGLVLYFLNVDLAMAFGFLALLLNFIPSIGSIIATLLPVPLVLVSPDSGPGVVAAVIIVPGAIQMTIGNFVEPRMMGKSLELHPVMILLALIFWGMLWGIVGMFLAVPITAIVKILLARYEYTKTLADIMEGNLEVLERH